MLAADFAQRVNAALGRAPLLVGDAQKMVRRIGWCSGAAQDELAAAAALGCDLYLSGEIREHRIGRAISSGWPYGNRAVRHSSIRTSLAEGFSWSCD